MGALAWVREGGCGLCGHLARLPVNLRIAQARTKVVMLAETISKTCSIVLCADGAWVYGTGATISVTGRAHMRSPTSLCLRENRAITLPLLAYGSNDTIQPLITAVLRQSCCQDARVGVINRIVFMVGASPRSRPRPGRG